jgi:hypothetical protein
MRFTITPAVRGFSGSTAHPASLVRGLAVSTGISGAFSGRARRAGACPPVTSLAVVTARQ